MNINLDKWQEEVLATEGNIVLRSGRQVGKSTVISIKAAEYALKNSQKTILIISSVERQAYFLFEKTLSYLLDNYKDAIKSGKHKPTKSRLRLKNGSTIYSLPAGLDGHGIRGLTVDLLIADEAAFIPEEVWPAVTPMLAVTKGNLILLSTPHGKGGFFYQCFSDESFKSFHISSEQCNRIDKSFLERERQRLSMVQYAQEYLGEFIDELRQFFPTNVIQQCLILKNENRSPKYFKRYLGVDVGRMGGDENVMLSLEREDERLEQFNLEISKRFFITETVRQIKHADSQFDYTKIYIDDGGMGVGVYDPLREDEQTKRKVCAINNASRSIDYVPNMNIKPFEKKTRVMKEDLYANLLNLMEKKKIKLFESPEIMLSLKSIQYEYQESGKIKIFGSYSHITEALVRAAWCTRDKSLNIYAA